MKERRANLFRRTGEAKALLIKNKFKKRRTSWTWRQRSLSSAEFKVHGTFRFVDLHKRCRATSTSIKAELPHKQNGIGGRGGGGGDEKHSCSAERDV